MHIIFSSVAWMPWLKALHIITMVAWLSGLLYLPRLFVYHADALDIISLERFSIMEYRLYTRIMMPAGLLTTVLGFWLLSARPNWYVHQTWMQAKLFLVSLLWVYHFYCGHLVKQFRKQRNRHSALFYRWFNEFPTLLLFAIVILIVIKPVIGLGRGA